MENKVLEKETLTHKPVVPSAGGDLSTEIARTVERRPGDRVLCRRVSRNTYRVNWYSPETPAKGSAMFLENLSIRDSRFLRVTQDEGRLNIEDLTVQTARNN
jgi:hypothetical protein